MKRVIMAEKKNAAEDICRAIGLKNITREGSSGFIHGKNEDDDEIVITWSNGHCIELPEPEDIKEQYKKWILEDLPIPLNDDSYSVLKVKSDKRRLFYDIQDELKDADDIVNAGDAGREGELIQRWIIDLALRGRAKYPSRLWTQSLTEKAIKEAYNNGLLGSNEKERVILNNLYDGGRARAIMDKYIGYNYSRLISLTQTNGVTVNYGRCKTPLVHAIVERDREIENFVSVPYSYLMVDFEKNGHIFKAFYINEDKERVEVPADEREAVLGEIVKNRRPEEVKVIEINKKDKYQTAAAPYDTMQIQKEMAVKYNYDADKTLEILEKLYDTHHILTYPRTESKYYTKDLRDNLSDTLKSLCFGEFAQYVEEALNGNIPDKYFNDTKVADHHALAPVDPGDLEEKYKQLSEEEKNVYDAILKNFIALYLPNYEYETQEIIVGNVNSADRYLIKGKADKVLGFKKIYEKDKIPAEEENEEYLDQKLPDISDGDLLRMKQPDGINIIDTKTKPKAHYTISTLLDFMKKNNIGTGATRDKLIKELTERKGRNADSSVEKKGKYFIATDFGRKMDDIIPDNLKSIEHLKYLEEQIQGIIDGKITFGSFIRDMEADFNKANQDLSSNVSVKLAAEKPDRKTLEGAVCPVCGKVLNDFNWGYACSGWKKDGSGCDFSVGKKIFNKTLSEKVIKQLINDRKTKEKLKKLKGKSGKEFEAYLILEIDSNGKAKISPKFD